MVTQSIDPTGLIALAVSPQTGAPLKSGESIILYLEIEALATGETVIGFEPTGEATNARGYGVTMQMTETRLIVK